MADENAYSQQDPSDTADEWSAKQFQIDQTLARVRTVVLVAVTAVTGTNGAVASPPTVTVTPLTKIIDGRGNVTSHGSISNIPVTRLGGGTNAVICDPVAGDVGWMAIADRDISVTKTTKVEAQPGSRRKFNLSDGIYVGSILSPVPTQYVRFFDDGMEWHDKHGNSILSNAAGITINGILFNRSGQVQGALAVTGALQLGGGIEALDGSGYTQPISTSGDIHSGGTVSGDTDVVASPGPSKVTLKGHISTSSSTPPTAGH